MYARDLSLMVRNGTIVVDISMGKRDSLDTHCSGLSILLL